MLTIRKAGSEDAGLLLEMIKKLADYEKMSNEVTATEEMIRENVFGSGSNIEALFVFSGDNAVAFALYFFNFSTFTGKKGLYLEDLYVVPEERGNGIGKYILKYLAGIAVEKNCGRFEWAVLDWNEPAIKFYKSLGAKPMNDWTIFRLAEDKIKPVSEMNVELL